MSASTCRSSGAKTVDGVISDRPTLLCGVNLAIGTGDASVILYDNASAASGTKLAEIKVIATAFASKEVFFDRPVKASNGIYMDITGTGASCIVYTG